MDTKELTLEALLGVARVGTINFFSLSAESSQEPYDAEEARGFTPGFLVQYHPRADDAAFRLHLHVEVESSMGTATVDVATQWVLTDYKVSEIPPAVLTEFVNGEGFETLYPYAREAIGDLTRRVFDVPITMPVLKRGDLAFQI